LQEDLAQQVLGVGHPLGAQVPEDRWPQCAVGVGRRLGG
jgi:hypothetical protein